MAWRRALVCLCWLSSCERQPAGHATATPVLAAQTPAARAAFIVYLAEGKTLVIPTAERDASELLDGLWLPTPSSAVRYGSIDERPLDPNAILVAVCVDGDDRCDVEAPLRMAFDGTPVLIGQDGEQCGCVYVAGVSDDQPWDYEGEDIEEEDAESDADACEPEAVGTLVSPPRLVAVVSGVVHFEETTYIDECAAGMPAWEAQSRAVEVSPSYPPRTMSAPVPSTCADAGVYGMDYDNKPESVAQGTAEVEYPVLRSGQRARVGVEYSRENGVSSCRGVIEPVSSQNCPSDIDPCGRLDPEDAAAQSDYWLASDGSYLLVPQSSGLEVTDRRSQAKFDVELPDGQAIVGVHFVADASGYLDALGPTPRWRYTAPGQAAEIGALRSTARYLERVKELLAADQLVHAQRMALAGLAFEHAYAIDTFGTRYDERIELLDLLVRIAAASDRPAEASVLRERAKLLRGHINNPM